MYSLIAFQLLLLRSASSTFSSSSVSESRRAFFTTLVVRITFVVTLDTLPPIIARPSHSFAFERDQSIFLRSHSLLFHWPGHVLSRAFPVLPKAWSAIP